MSSFREIYRNQRTKEREAKAQRRREAEESFKALPPATQRLYRVIAASFLCVVGGGFVLIAVLNGRDQPSAPRASVATSYVEDDVAVETPGYGDDPIPTPATEAPTLVAPSGISRSETCAEFMRITSTLTYDDLELAASYHVLAGRTADTALAAEIRKVGDAFERHDPQVMSTGVMAYC